MPSGAILALAARGPSRQTRPLANQGVGLLLLDSLLNPISCNDETIRILSYPEAPQHVKRLDVFLRDTIRARLLNSQSPRHSHFVTEFVSGKRRYRCWAFHLNRHLRGSSHATLELLLERSTAGSSGGVIVARPFQQRDCQSNEHQSQHGEHLFPVDHDQDGGLQPLRDTRENDQRKFQRQFRLTFVY